MKTQMQKVFAIVNKETQKIVAFGLNAKEVKEEWDNYYVGEESKNTHELKQTFMSQEEIKKEMGI
jgi:hypothetical protein